MKREKNMYHVPQFQRAKSEKNHAVNHFSAFYMSKMVRFLSLFSRGCLPLPIDGPLPDQRPKADRLQEQDCGHLWDQTGQKF